MRHRHLLCLITLTATAIVIGGAPSTAAAPVALPPGTDPGTVIVVQRSAGAPSGLDRAAETADREAGLAAAMTAAGATVTDRLGLIDAVVARVTPAQQAALERRPDVEAVVPDRRVRIHLPTSPTTHAAARTVTASGVPEQHSQVYGDACPSNPAEPEIDPEALTTMKVRASGNQPGAQSYADGAGVRVGIVAQGIDPKNPDLLRSNGSSVIKDYYDVTGAGTAGPVGSFETFLDAESVAAQGHQVFDLNKEGYGDIDPPGCTLRIMGVAPGATLDVVQAFDIQGNASVSELLRAIDHLVTVDHVDVLNESLADEAYPGTDAIDPLALANDAAVAAGVTVVEASGDSGIGNTLGVAADDPQVLAVGADDQLRALEQIGYAGLVGRWSDGNIANLSSSGVAQNGKTLDVVAPGFYTWISCTPTPQYPDCPQTAGGPVGLELAGGTSESAPLTAGVAALVVQTFRRHHGGRSPSPRIVRDIITGTADDLGAPTAEQGAGQVDALRAVQAAAAWDGAATGQAQSVNPTQADLVAPVGASASTAIQITNHGRTPVTDAVGLRSERPAGVLRFPFTYDQGTAGYAAEAFTVSVPRGTQRLAITGLVADPTVETSFDVYVFDPNGTYVADAAPQGPTNTSYAEVDRPIAGNWTVKVFGFSSSDPPFVGSAEVDVRFYRPIPGGTVSPSRVTLAPGATATVHATLPAAATQVDGTAALQLTDTADQRVSTIPITVRRTVRLLDGTGSFTGTLTGGNGRPQGALQNSTFYVDVPRGAPALQAHIALPARQGLSVFAYLVGPDGVAIDRESNLPAGRPQPSVDLATLRPRPGRWRLTVGVDGTLPGTTDAITYSGSLTTDAPPMTASGLPRGAVLPANQSVTATVHVVNDTAATHAYLADPRTNTLALQPLDLTTPVTLPINYENPAPTVLVPPLTTGLLALAASEDPLSIELQLGSAFERENFAQWNDPVVIGETGHDPAVFAAGTPLTPGLWRVYPQPTRTPTATARLQAWAVTPTFNRDITTTTDNPWQGTAGTALVLAPGQAGDIRIRIDPTISASGIVAVESYDSTHQLVSILARFRYSYRVG